MQVRQVISNLRQQARILREAEEEVGAALKLLVGLVPNGDVPQRKVKKGKKKMSAEARARIGAAAKKRWAEKKAAEGKK